MNDEMVELTMLVLVATAAVCFAMGIFLLMFALIGLVILAIGVLL